MFLHEALDVAADALNREDLLTATDALVGYLENRAGGVRQPEPGSDDQAVVLVRRLFNQLRTVQRSAFRQGA